MRGGATQVVPTDDIRGVPRGTPPHDIGAYERDAQSVNFADSFERL